MFRISKAVYCSVLLGLSGTLQKCVSCHNIYQIQSEPYPHLHK